MQAFARVLKDIFFTNGTCVSNQDIRPIAGHQAVTGC